MVIVAIMVGGGLFGVPGMIVGVPVFAVLNAAVWKLIGRSLDEKDMSADAEFYRDIDCVDPVSGKCIANAGEKIRIKSTGSYSKSGKRQNPGPGLGMKLNECLHF